METKRQVNKFRVYDLAGYVLGDFSADQLGPALDKALKTRGRFSEVTVRRLTSNERPIAWPNNRVHQSKRA